METKWSVSAPANWAKSLGIVLVLAGSTSTSQDTEAHSPKHRVREGMVEEVGLA